MQALLRNQLYKIKEENLSPVWAKDEEDGQIKFPRAFSESNAYTDTLGLFNYYLRVIQNRGKKIDLNENTISLDMQESKFCRQKIYKVAQKVNQWLVQNKHSYDPSVIPEAENRGNYYRIENRIRNYVINECFIKDSGAALSEIGNLDVAQEEDVAQENKIFNTKSVIASVLKRKTHQSVWGDEQDLRCLSEKWDVCLLIYENKPANLPSDDLRPVVRINHPTESHWTTLLDPFMGKQIPKNDPVLALKGCLHQPILNLNEIKYVLLQYTKGTGLLRFLYGAWGRNHLDKANELIKLCDEREPVSTIMKNIEDLLQGEYNKNSDFQSTLRYLHARYEAPVLHVVQAAPPHEPAQAPKF